MTKIEAEEIPNERHIEIVVCMTTCMVESRCKPLGCDKLKKVLKILNNHNLYRPYFEPSGVRNVTNNQPKQYLPRSPAVPVERKNIKNTFYIE